MKCISALKTAMDDFSVEYEVISPIDIEAYTDPHRREIAEQINSLDGQIEACEAEIQKLAVEIDRLTNHADGLDYTVAVASGILTGLIDSFLVGDYNPNIEDIVTEFASKKAKKKGEEINNYGEAREWLENNAHVDHDGAYNNDPIFNKDSKAPNGHTHRLDDLAHHPTLLGLAASIFFQFFRITIFINKDGELRPVFVKQDIKELSKVWAPAVLSGIMIWLANIAENYFEDKLDEDIPAPIKKLVKLISATPNIIQILKCADKWYSHIMSDVGPKSDGTIGKGIPGIFLSFLKEISILIPSPKLHSAIQSLYNSGTMNFDKELVVIEKMKKQAIPVIINEVIVRGFYFVRRLISEYKEHNNFTDINWQNVIPFGNRTVERMMTIASGTFVAVDIADAAIRSGGFNASCLLRVNFVGVGRFAIAIVTDIGMGIKRNKLVKENIGIMSQELSLLNAKVYYRCAELHYAEIDMLNAEKEMWMVAQNTEDTLIELYNITEESVAYMKSSLDAIHGDLEKISEYREKIEQLNPIAAKNIKNIIKWGKE